MNLVEFKEQLSKIDAAVDELAEKASKSAIKHGIVLLVVNEEAAFFKDPEQEQPVVIFCNAKGRNSYIAEGIVSLLGKSEQLEKTVAIKRYEALAAEFSEKIKPPPPPRTKTKDSIGVQIKSLFRR